MSDRYPFSAVVGHDELRLALTLCAIAPAVGGVLVRGEKGTAKSTAARALAPLLPPRPDGAPARLVELPIGATEDRVVGSLDLHRALGEGRVDFTPGLLADADGGILYVDEVNLLSDHLVDVLLDAAAMGRVTVERDAVSRSYPARFVLVGTMNPEEGELRPQLLDRFGLAVDVRASREVDARVEVMRRRLAFEADPAAFAAEYADADADQARRIAEARDRLPAVALPDAELRRIAAVCAAFDVDGMRADLVIARAARAHAAWRGAAEVTEDDVRIAAALALPHRKRRDPFDEPGLDDAELDRALDDARQADDPDPEPDDDGPDGGPDGGQPTEPPSTRDDSAASAPEPQGAPLPTARHRTVGRLAVPGTGTGVATGRRSKSRSDRGSVVRAAPAGTGAGLHLAATLRAAAPAQAARGRVDGPLHLAPSDLRSPIREATEGNLVVFVVDLSGSMAARERIALVGEAAVSLLRDAYQRRDKVAVIGFRGAEATLLVPPTRSVDVAVARLARARTGGRTPLAEGLIEARKLLRREDLRPDARRPLVVVLTDGRATSGRDPLPRALAAAAGLHADGRATVVVDCETSMVRLGLAAKVAAALGAPMLPLGGLSPQDLARVA
ncbi:VWA domain-containing protein [Tsukamurella ocularis]|uniref:VWA domain-containing protein n=1 Tax=Tsukamurella ocularis TaxID=1970234 RepID=UPI002169E584|nr:VWA domain-containing protein [Tsukamurella ocularis]MCS3780236.1 magnesium chelatase subunit D [Tsukamurella ocularis]MCS3786210.1 magnesium chelatase subunit D [Tsukamurella ocularis]MCS3849574.1 magnesium chelatase subunit D [Tsukamurella ocularis]